MFQDIEALFGAALDKLRILSARRAETPVNTRQWRVLTKQITVQENRTSRLAALLER